jgi:DNA-binding transcriptional LysR family regulator
MEEKLVRVTAPRKRGKDAGGYVYVDWGPEFAAHHNRAFPDLANPAIYVGLGPLGLQLVLKDGGSGYFRLHAVAPYLRARRLALVRGAPEFLYPAYAVYSENPDDPSVVEPALAGLRSVAAALQSAARPKRRAKARK